MCIRSLAIILGCHTYLLPQYITITILQLNLLIYHLTKPYTGICIYHGEPIVEYHEYISKLDVGQDQNLHVCSELLCPHGSGVEGEVAGHNVVSK